MKFQLQMLAGVLVLGTVALAAADDFGIRIARFSGDRQAALSFTLDDGWADNATIAAPLFSRYGLHVTFFLVPGYLAQTEAERGAHKYGQILWPRWREIALAGHEIGNHTLHHQSLTKASDAVAQAEIDGGQNLIAEKIGVTPISFAYPGNGRDDRVRKFVYARHAVAREFETGYGGQSFTAAKANQLVDAALREQRWMVAMLHAITNGYAAFFSTGVLEEHLKYVQKLQDRLWVDTFGNVGRYVKERDAAQLVCRRDANSASLTLTSKLDTNLFNVPLTVVIERVRAATAVARRAGSDQPLPVVIAPDRLLVEVVPSPAVVEVRWQPRPMP